MHGRRAIFRPLLLPPLAAAAAAGAVRPSVGPAGAPFAAWHDPVVRDSPSSVDSADSTLRSLVAYPSPASLVRVSQSAPHG
jgi:hypothetical protein